MSTVTCQRCGKVEENRATAGAKYCLKCHARGKPKPTKVGRLIHLLIEERAKVIAMCYPRVGQSKDIAGGLCITDMERSQARREIEAEVLTPGEPRAR